MVLKRKKIAARLKSLSIVSALLLTFAAPVKSVSAMAGIYGDVNLDTVVTANDVIVFIKHFLGTPLTGKALQSADIVDDGQVMLTDLATLKQYCVGDKVQRVGEIFGGEPVQPIIKYYAADAQYYLAAEENTNEGFEGSAYVNYDNVSGGYIEWTVNAEITGNSHICINYANGSDVNRPLEITVNNSDVYWNVDFASTGAWTSWNTNSIIAPLAKGENKIRATAISADGGPNVDYITVQGTTIEATNPSGDKSTESKEGARVVEKLGRGLIATQTNVGMLVNWRYLGTDRTDTEFKLYRDNSLIYTSGKDAPTTYLDKTGSISSNYTLETVSGNSTITSQCMASLSNGYLELGLNKPNDMTMPDGTTCSYSPNDVSVGDVDNDGEYELFVKWDPSNAKDNSHSGYTGNVYIDCYKLNGTRLWRVDLGKNIRAGAHYTQFMVYDFDSDGTAEMVCKTSDGTVDGKGNIIGNGGADYRSAGGYILTGNEYLTLFNGRTGAAMDTINYEPGRGTVSSWGDNYGNRVDRFLAGVAYLDGKTPSVVMCRGYYTRAVLVAYDIENGKLVKRWKFDSTDGGYDKQGKPNSNYSGQGAHCLSVADVDGDGFDEIIYGSATIDHDGKGLYSSGLGHGDALHVSDFVPERPGLEIWMCLESNSYGATLRDAATGSIIFGYKSDKDCGRGVGANIFAGNKGSEFWGSNGSGLYTGSGSVIGSTSGMSSNFLSWWDGDLERELLDGYAISKFNGNGVTRLLTASGCAQNNGTKANPALSADIFGDWREEVIYRTEDNTKLRIYSTTFETDYRLFTLMHDTQYRCAVAWQNTAYNQPPHPSFYLGSDTDLPALPNVQ